jgi:O-antigen ligase
LGLPRITNGHVLHDGLEVGKLHFLETVVNALSLLLALDPLINQLLQQAQVAALGLSLLQIIRGVLIGLSLLYLARAWIGGRFNDRSVRVAKVAGWTIGSLCLAVALEWVREGQLPKESAIGYSQIAYWLLIWVIGEQCIRTSADSNRVLIGLFAGCILAGLSIILLHYGGLARSVYGDLSVKDSAGGFATAKAVSGQLVVGWLLCIYGWWLGRRLMSLLCGVVVVWALFLTFNRSGQVAFVVATCWLVAWSARRRTVATVPTVAIALGILAVVALTLRGASASRARAAALQERWSDFSAGEDVGSGRLRIWRTAIIHFMDCSWTDTIWGVGIRAERSLFERSYGMRIHAHSDPLDMLLLGGVLGLGMWLMFAAQLYGRVHALDTGLTHYAIALGCVITYLVKGVLTGQFFDPSVMCCYTLCVTCLTVEGQQIGRNRHSS